MKLLLFVIAAVVIADQRLARQALRERQFRSWTKQHEKTYDAEEFTYRMSVFNDNLEKIEQHNKEGHSWTMGVNQFADMTAYEFKAFVKRGNGGGYVPEQMERIPKILEPATCSSIDWVDQGKVTPVKNQGQCGSCWSFSTTGAVEGRYAIKYNQLTSLSEQNLVDCDHTDSGCNGGLMDYAFSFIEGNGGLCTEAQYPYVATRHFSCQQSSHCSTLSSPVTGYQDVLRDSTSQMESAICDGPVSIAIEADQSSFQFYNGGVLTSSCGSNLDHGVLAVGFGSTGGQEYWKVKNSWGAGWGMNGYILLCRNCGKNSGAGQCGLLAQPSYPTV